jgi:hypothetical protein
MIRIADAKSSGMNASDREADPQNGGACSELTLADAEAEKRNRAMTDSAGKSAGLGRAGKSFSGKHSSMNRVAHDPALTAELLLLVRMSFADKSVEAGGSRCLCGNLHTAVGAPCGRAGDILKYLNDFGYETSNAQAAEMLAGLE